MANAKQQENLLLTEHFTWPPISLLDEIINTVNEVLYKCTDTLESGLSSADPAVLGFAAKYASGGKTPAKDEDGRDVYSEAKLEIEEGMLKLETLMEGAVDKNFDRLEIWTLRNVLCLPQDVGKWVRLGHYENLTIPPENPSITPESLQALRRKLVETQKLHAALVAEKTRNDAQIQRLRSLLEPTPDMKREPRSSASPSRSAHTNGDAPFAFLTHTHAAKDIGIQALPRKGTSTSAESRTPLTTHTTFTTSQLPYLRELLATLRPHLATAALPAQNDGEKEELAKERKTYIESQTKRILGRRGVDTINGVEGVVEGSRVRSEEVRGLENIVAGLSRSKGGGGEDEAMDTS